MVLATETTMEEMLLRLLLKLLLLLRLLVKPFLRLLLSRPLWEKWLKGEMML